MFAIVSINANICIQKIKQNQRTMMHLRCIAEHFGKPAGIDWNKEKFICLSGSTPPYWEIGLYLFKSAFFSKALRADFSCQ